jgi:hypothetical protein
MAPNLTDDATELSPRSGQLYTTEQAARWFQVSTRTVVSANLLHRFGQFNLRKPRRRER